MDLMNKLLPSWGEQEGKLYGGDPNFYWKQNYYCNWVDNWMNSLNISPFEDRIEANSLSQHKQVILHTMEQVSEANTFCDYDISQLPNPQYTILNLESTDYFIMLLADQGMLAVTEALDFASIFTKRTDWKKLCIELIQTVSIKFHQELAYIFYISLKIVIQIRSYVKLTCPELKSLLRSYIQANQNSMQQKLQILGKLAGFKEALEKLCLTMMLAIYGIFVNPFYDSKEEKYQHLQISIKQQEDNSMKRKDIKIKYRKLRQSRPSSAAHSA